MNKKSFYVVYDVESDRYLRDGISEYVADNLSPEYYVVDETRYYSKSYLKKWGITDNHLVAANVKYDLKVRNPRFPSASMYLYKADTIDEKFPF